MLNQILADFASFVWGLPLLFLLTGGGIYLTLLIFAKPLLYLKRAFKLLTNDNGNSGKEQINSFQTLSTALSSTIGMGNIAGVAVAISIGGPGAIFWMWVSGIIGMITKFFTCSLSVMYRARDENGDLQGGVMYFIQEGMGKKFIPLAQFFAVAGLIGALPVFNVNQFTQALNDIILQPSGIHVGLPSNFVIGISLAIITILVTQGGLKRIGQTTQNLVPAMVILYFLCVGSIIVFNIEQLPDTIYLIFSEAFYPEFYKGEAFMGGTLGGLILLGIRRGAFSNEAGIGTATLAHGASNKEEPIEEGLIAMLGPMIDTLVICTLTAVAIIITGAWQSDSLNGVSLTNQAFVSGLPQFGSFLLMLCISVFSISSLFSYSYYGSKCMAYLFGSKKKQYYQYMYLISIIVGCTSTLDAMINLIDGFFALMAIPTMFATLFLAPKVVIKAKDYFAKISS